MTKRKEKMEQASNHSAPVERPVDVVGAIQNHMDDVYATIKINTKYGVSSELCEALHHLRQAQISHDRCMGCE